MSNKCKKVMVFESGDFNKFAPKFTLKSHSPGTSNISASVTLT